MSEELDPKRSISSDDECWDSLEGLWRGDLIPLAEYLEQQTGTLHPLVQCELAEMIRGINRQGEKASWKISAKYSKRGRPKGQTADRDKLIVKALPADGVERDYETKLDALQAAALATDLPPPRAENAVRTVERARQSDREKRDKLVRRMRAHGLLSEKANDKN